ncbi:MAG: hypothetical protein QF858_01200 [Candidatus Pacebacteria bacterium]|nr:hypothetical protein [Candidatus Paceibacterota bacterium]
MLASKASGQHYHIGETFVLKDVHYTIGLPACEKREQVVKILNHLDKGEEYKALTYYHLYLSRGKCVPANIYDVYVFDERYPPMETRKGILLTPVKVHGFIYGERYSWVAGCVITADELRNQAGIETCGLQKRARF